MNASKYRWSPSTVALYLLSLSTQSSACICRAGNVNIITNSQLHRWVSTPFPFSFICFISMFQVSFVFLGANIDKLFEMISMSR